MKYYAIPGGAETYLAHWGLKGMKWGVRRFQNPDGTLTALGKERYGTRKKFEAARAEAKERRKESAIRIAKTAAKTTAVVGAAAAGFMLGTSLYYNVLPSAIAGLEKTVVQLGAKLAKDVPNAVTEANIPATVLKTSAKMAAKSVASK